MEQHAETGGTIVSGNVGGNLTVINNFNRADERLALFTPLKRERFAKLMSRHRLFSGRRELLAVMDAAAAGPGGNYVLVTGSSGYGKTALLANWVSQRREAGATPCYTFVSRIDNTQDEDFTLSSLYEQLLLAYGQRIPLEPQADWHTSYIDLLTTPPPEGTRVVVVIDGLDEANGWVAPDLFPQLPFGVTVIVSAREMADHDWPEILELPPGTDILTLDRLSGSEIKELLEQAVEKLIQRTGPAARTTAIDPELLAAVEEVSLGDPYYVSLLAADIRQNLPFSAAELRAQPAGLFAYFNRWWRELESPQAETAVREVLSYLLVAQGPISRRELVDIDIDDTLEDWTVEPTIEKIGRYVVGDSRKGYVIGHDRFRNYLLEERIGEVTRRTALNRLLTYCRSWSVNESGYALRHLPEHLRDEALSDELAALVSSDEWLGAHIRHDPSGATFLRGVRIAWQDAEKLALGDLTAGRSAWIGRELEYALAVASIRSILTGLPAELLRQLLVRRLWTEDAVLAAVREISDPVATARVLSHLAPELSPQAARAALAVANALPDEHKTERDVYVPRATALMALAPRLEGAAQGETVAAVFAARIPGPGFKWLHALAEAKAFVSILPAERVREALVEAERRHDRELLESLTRRLHALTGDSETIEVLNGFERDESKATALSILAPLLGVASASQAFALASELSTRSADGSPRAEALRGLWPVLSPDLARRALEALDAVEDPRLRTWASVLLTARLDDEPEDSRLTQVVTAVRSLAEPVTRTAALWDVLSIYGGTLPDLVSEGFDSAIESQNSEALAVFATLLDEAGAQRALVTLEHQPSLLTPALAVAVAEHLSPDSQVPAVRRIIAAVTQASAEDDAARRPSALIATVSMLLPPDERTRVLAEELGLLHSGKASWDALNPIARAAPDALWPDILDLATSRDPRWRASALADLVAIAPEARRDQVLELALDAARSAPVRDDQDAPGRGSALTSLIADTPETRQEALVGEALAASQTIDDAALLVHAECSLLEFSDESTVPALVERLNALPSSTARSAVLMDAAASRHALLRRTAIQIAESASEPNQRLATLADLTRMLPDEDIEFAAGVVAAAAEKADDQALVRAAEDAPVSLLGVILASAESRKHSIPLAVLAATLVHRLQGPLQLQAFRWALTFPSERNADGRDPALRAWILENVAESLPSDLATQAADAAQETDDPVSRFPPLAVLAASLPAEQRPALVDYMTQLAEIQPVPGAAVQLAVRVIGASRPGPEREKLARIILDRLPADDPVTSANDLVSVAPFVEGEVADDAFRFARRLSLPQARAYASAALFRNVSESVRQSALPGVLDDVLACKDEVARCECLAQIAATMPPGQRTALVEEGLSAAWEQGDAGVSLVRELLATAPLDDQGSAAVIGRALRAALAIGGKDDNRRLPDDQAGADSPPDLTVAWSRLVPSGPAMRDVHPDVVSIVGGDVVIDIFRTRAEQLPSQPMITLIEHGIQVLKQESPESWAEAAAELLPHLPVSRGALEQAGLSLDGMINRAIALESLAPPLPNVWRAHSSARRDEKEDSRFVRALRLLMPHLASIDRERLHTLWREFLAVASSQTRPAMLVDIRNAAPVTMALGETDGIKEALDGLERARRSWP